MACTSIARRRLLLGAAAASLFGKASAQWFPSRNMRVVIPTGQGGGAERLARAFDDFWGKLLKTHFEYSFYAGAAGQVGYELWIHKREHDGYNLLFGNMGPEMIMYALRKPKYRFPEDYQYFCRTDVDDSVIFVRKQSKIQKLEDLAAEAKKRSVNVAVSRLPHPASIGMLALGGAIKGKFNLVPYGGGNPTQVAVLNGEADCGAAPPGGSAAAPRRVHREVQARKLHHHLPAGEQGVRHRPPRPVLVALLGDPQRGDREVSRALRAPREDLAAGV